MNGNNRQSNSFPEHQNVTMKFLIWFDLCFYFIMTFFSNKRCLPEEGTKNGYLPPRRIFFKSQDLRMMNIATNLYIENRQWKETIFENCRHIKTGANSHIKTIYFITFVSLTLCKNYYLRSVEWNEKTNNNRRNSLKEINAKKNYVYVW